MFWSGRSEGVHLEPLQMVEGSLHIQSVMMIRAKYSAAHGIYGSVDVYRLLMLPLRGKHMLLRRMIPTAI